MFRLITYTNWCKEWELDFVCVSWAFFGYQIVLLFDMEVISLLLWSLTTITIIPFIQSHRWSLTINWKQTPVICEQAVMMNQRSNKSSLEWQKHEHDFFYLICLFYQTVINEVLQYFPDHRFIASINCLYSHYNLVETVYLPRFLIILCLLVVISLCDY